MDIHAAGKRDRDTGILQWLPDGHCAVALGGDRPPTLATHFDFQGWPAYTHVLGFADPRAAGARSPELGARLYWGAAWLALRLLDEAIGEGGRGDAGIGTPPFLEPELVRAGDAAAPSCAR